MQGLGHPLILSTSRISQLPLLQLSHSNWNHIWVAQVKFGVKTIPFQKFGVKTRSNSKENHQNGPLKNPLETCLHAPEITKGRFCRALNPKVWRTFALRTLSGAAEKKTIPKSRIRKSPEAMISSWWLNQPICCWPAFLVDGEFHVTRIERLEKVTSNSN